MRKLVLLSALTLLPLAAACPLKAGYIANGELENTISLTPFCTPGAKKIAAEVKPGEYGELYTTSLDMAGGLKMINLAGLFRVHGWRQAKSPNSKTFVFTKGKKQTVVYARERTDDVLVMVLGDR